MTLKVHVILHHYADYFECTGQSLADTNGEFVESAHYSLKKHERNCNYKVVNNLGSLIHKQKYLQSLSTFNVRRAGFTAGADFRIRKSKNITKAHKPSLKYKHSFINKYYPD